MSLWKRPFGPTSGAASVANQTAMNQQAALAGPLPALQVLTSNAETVIVSPENILVALVITIPPNTVEEQSLIDLVASGDITTTAASNLTLKVYSGTSTTVGNDTLIGSSGAIAQNTAKAPFWAHATLIFDSIALKLDGKIEFFVNHTLVAAVAISNTITLAAGGNTTDPVANFLLSLTSSGASAGNPTTINVQTFSVG